jgi:glycosyltransferase involved in cell wall biosynthesis
MMYKGLQVAVIVPAHNEEQLIGRTITTVPACVDLIVLIDDASTDETVKRALETGDPRLNIIEHEVNTGVGGAIIDGHKRALELGADVNVVMAGDAQMNPAYLPALLDPITDHGYGFTKANRFYSRQALAGMPALRVFGSIVLSFATKLASGYWNLFDPQNGYTAVTREALNRIDLDRIARRYSFENDLLISLGIANVRAKDVPIPGVYGEEVSGMRLARVVPEISRLLFTGFWRRILLKYVLMSFSPIALLLITGLFLCLAGAALGIWAIVVTPNDAAPSAGTVLLAAGPLLVGINMLVHALALDIQQSPD